MKKIILIQLLCLSCLATAWAQKADSLYIFRFVQEKDVFYVPWRDNGGQLEQLVSLLQQYKEAITAGSIPLYINGYCTGQPTRRENLRMAATRSNHVKSELIRRAGLEGQRPPLCPLEYFPRSAPLPRHRPPRLPRAYVPHRRVQLQAHLHRPPRQLSRRRHH